MTSERLFMISRMNITRGSQAYGYESQRSRPTSARDCKLNRLIILKGNALIQLSIPDNVWLGDLAPLLRDRQQLRHD